MKNEKILSILLSLIMFFFKMIILKQIEKMDDIN